MASPATWACTEFWRRPEPPARLTRASRHREPRRSRPRTGANAAGCVVGRRCTPCGAPISAPYRQWPTKTVIPLLVLVAAAILLYLCLGHWVRRERTVLGLKNEVIVSADDSTRGMPTLRSKRYGLVGRPDQLIRMGQMLIPVEQKPTASRMHQSHM